MKNENTRTAKDSAFAKANPLTVSQWQDAITLAGIPREKLTNSERKRIAFYNEVYGI